MSVLTLLSDTKKVTVKQEYIAHCRHLTADEIAILVKNRNISDDASWQNIYVNEEPGSFDPSLIYNCELYGFIVIHKLRPACLKYHDLELRTGLYNSRIENCVFADDVAVRNVSFLHNYHIGNRVMLFNIQEMSCTEHSKFGRGILKEGEPESNRIWIGIANENDNRAVLPFEEMIPADAYLWSRYRDDEKLMQRFIELTEYGNTKTLDTFGIIEDDVVIKNTTLLKDVHVGCSAYIKGAFKLKNMTVLSSPDEPSQIGEGVEMVNGIMGYGSRVFYQAVAVRFVIGRNCQLKYGARLLNSVLGDNSTVSCCELLNNLIFPFHEQHHNSSFLIATTIMGQSNIAAGATIGSNHNSRSPDGEIYAERGFWPGLCSDFKHNSRFASFVLVAKGSYQRELNITYPFSLVATSGADQPVHIIPAYWFLYNMFAIARNNYKFLKRDKRVVKVQHVETDPLAPDTMQEIMTSLDRLIELTGAYLLTQLYKPALDAHSPEKLHQVAKDFLHQNPDAVFTLPEPLAQKKFGAVIYKPVKAYKEYRKIVKYFAASTLMEFCTQKSITSLTADILAELEQMPLYTSWLNVGGQIIPEKVVFDLFDRIKDHRIETWAGVHAFYDDCNAKYAIYKARYALYLFEQLYSRPMSQFNTEIFEDIIGDVTTVSNDMYTSSITSRAKDYTDFFRTITYRNEEEMTAVLGTIDDNEFLHTLQKTTEQFNNDLKVVFKDVCNR
ncbi:MAG: DUF4954 family protein [Treponema sp.]|nr:DUF4954 family protein [Treponema sp.]